MRGPVTNDHRAVASRPGMPKPCHPCRFGTSEARRRPSSLVLDPRSSTSPARCGGEGAARVATCDTLSCTLQWCCVLPVFCIFRCWLSVADSLHSVVALRRLASFRFSLSRCAASLFVLAVDLLGGFPPFVHA